MPSMPAAPRTCPRTAATWTRTATPSRSCRSTWAAADRCYADENLDGVIDGDPRNSTADPEPCGVNQVDLGAYEAGLPGWQTHRGGELLAAGRLYRLGFHAETNITSTVTVGMALS